MLHSVTAGAKRSVRSMHLAQTAVSIPTHQGLSQTRMLQQQRPSIVVAAGSNTTASDRLQRVIAKIDALNSQDPRKAAVRHAVHNTCSTAHGSLV